MYGSIFAWREVPSIIFLNIASSSSCNWRNGPSLWSGDASDIYHYLADRVSVVAQCYSVYNHSPDERRVVRRRNRQRQVWSKIFTDCLDNLLPVQPKGIGIAERM